MNRSGPGILYDDLTKQIKPIWSEVQKNIKLAPKNKSKGQQTHITTDNSDGRQQTLTGLNTRHETNATFYNHPKWRNFNINARKIDYDQEESHPSTRRNIYDYNHYKIND